MLLGIDFPRAKQNLKKFAHFARLYLIQKVKGPLDAFYLPDQMRAKK